MNNIPSYAELQEENEEVYQQTQAQKAQQNPKKTEDEYVRDFLILINKPVPNKWLKDLDVGQGRKIKYLPIDKVEFLLTRIFGVHWYVDILAEGVMFNSPFSRVRVTYKIPGTNIWAHQDGAGAVPAKVSKGSAASDMSQILSTAVQTGYPSTVSFGLSNAAARIGRLLGRGLNKPDSFDYDGLYNPETGKTEIYATQPTTGTGYTNQNPQVIHSGDASGAGVTVTQPSNGHTTEPKKYEQANMFVQQPASQPESNSSNEFKMEF